MLFHENEANEDSASTKSESNKRHQPHSSALKALVTHKRRDPSQGKWVLYIKASAARSQYDTASIAG
jgi:hypothetical protein